MVSVALMRILFLAHRLPYPPDKGERIRAFYELKYLAARHEVDLVCLADSKSDAEGRRALQDMCREVHVEVLSKPVRLLRAASSGIFGRPMSLGFFYSPDLLSRTIELLGRHPYDLIFVYCSSMEQFVPSPAPAPIVVDFVDADSAKWQQYARMCRGPRSWFFRREARAVAKLERALARRAALSLVTTPHDAKELIRSAGCESRVEVLRNGVHIPEDPAAIEDMIPRELKPYVVFVGTMDYRPNADAAEHFAKDIFGRLRDRYPDLHFLIVGRNPNSRVRRLQSIPGVKVTGAVPNVYPYFRQAEATVAPFRISQGFHNKMIESLAVGTPVIAASRAAAGIGLSPEQGLYVANSPEEFVEALDVLLSSSSLRQQVRQSAASLRRTLSWDVRLQRLGDLLANVGSAPIEGGTLQQRGC